MSWSKYDTELQKGYFWGNQMEEENQKDQNW